MIESMSDLQRYDNIETIAIWHNYTETYAHDWFLFTLCSTVKIN